MAQYWVVGGEYETTSFREIVGGAPEERHGPYDSYEAARADWARRAMTTIDNPHYRYRIEEDDSTEYWVVGGVYADTSFTELAAGRDPERYGPYPSEDKAFAKWRERAFATEEDPLVLYRVERVS